MTLAFPNPSRSFDEVRNAVRFTGHDGMFQVRFFVETSALAKPGGRVPTEAESLMAFDASRGSILDVARQAYSHGPRPFYVLTPADFR